MKKMLWLCRRNKGEVSSSIIILMVIFSIVAIFYFATKWQKQAEYTERKERAEMLASLSDGSIPSDIQENKVRLKSSDYGSQEFAERLVEKNPHKGIVGGTLYMEDGNRFVKTNIDESITVFKNVRTGTRIAYILYNYKGNLEPERIIHCPKYKPRPNNTGFYSDQIDEVSGIYSLGMHWGCKAIGSDVRIVKAKDGEAYTVITTPEQLKPDTSYTLEVPTFGRIGVQRPLVQFANR
ncbi:hypothetical protein HYV44_01760 [Candidatus Microgenomates bacterium]|nr:hypothetical protein [Candidatus Microgenomates bacterium]